MVNRLAWQSQMLRSGYSVARKIGLKKRSVRSPIVDAWFSEYIRHLPRRPVLGGRGGTT